MKKTFKTKDEAYEAWEKADAEVMLMKLKDNYQGYITRVEECDGGYMFEYGEEKIIETNV